MNWTIPDQRSGYYAQFMASPPRFQKHFKAEPNKMNIRHVFGKRIGFIFIIFAFATLLLCCGDNETQVSKKAPEKQKTKVPPQSNTVQIDLWTHSGAGGEVKVLRQFIEQFNAQQDDIRVKIIELPEADYSKQVEMGAFRAGIVGDLPCILDFDGPYASNYAWNGFLTPLDDFISDETKKDFLPSILAQGTLQDGKLYCLSQMESGLAIWANKVYLEKAGVRLPTVAKPWKREEFEDILSRLQALPEVEYALDMKMNYGMGEWFPYAFSPILQGFGADLIDRRDYLSSEGVLNGVKAVAAMKKVQGWFKKGYVDANTTSDTDFVDGKTALSWAGNWVFNTYNDKLGDNLLLLPMPDFGTGPKTGMGSWNWGITSTCKKPDAAWRALEYLLEPEQVLRISNAAGAIPARLSVLERSKLYAPGKMLHLYVEQFQAGFAVPRPITPAYPKISQAFSEAFYNIVHGADVKSELDKAVQTIDEDIRENEGYKLK